MHDCILEQEFQHVCPVPAHENADEGDALHTSQDY